MTSVADMARRLGGMRSLRGLPEALLLELASRVASRTLEAGDVVFRAGETATSFTFVVSGLVKVVRSLPDGTSSIVGLFGPRDSVGDAAVLGRSTYPASALVASDRATVLRVDATPVLDSMARDPSVAAAVNRALLDHTAALQAKIAVLTAGSAEQRVATLLLLLAERFGDEDESGSTLIPLALSRPELASLVGTTPETVIRTLTRFKKAGWVVTEAEGLAIHAPEKLREITRGA